MSLFIDRSTVRYFDSFGNKYIRQEALNKINDKSINHNIFRIQFYYVPILLYRFHRTYECSKILQGNMIALLHYTNLFSPNDYKEKENYGKRKGKP